MKTWIGLLVVAVVTGATFAWVGSARGFSARDEPSAVERTLARLLHRWSVPARARAARNPVGFSDEAWAQSRAHFADHCASCHANDGSGRTEMGQRLFPRAPDMRLAATQDLTDGELYWIIENGVRLTGMPAWGAGGDQDAETWALVHFVRHLAHLTPAQLAEMEAANPRSPSEIREELEDQQFLAGAEPPASPSTPAHHH